MICHSCPVTLDQSLLTHEQSLLTCNSWPVTLDLSLLTCCAWCVTLVLSLLNYHCWPFYNLIFIYCYLNRFSFVSFRSLLLRWQNIIFSFYKASIYQIYERVLLPKMSGWYWFFWYNINLLVYKPCMEIIMTNERCVVNW